LLGVTPLNANPRAVMDDSHLSFPANSRYSVQRMEDQYGLEAVSATSMAQDAQGFLWIGTQTGLYRYDGSRATKMEQVEGIVGHYITDVLIAPDGTPWFAGLRGIAHYKDGEFERLAIPQTAMPLSSGNQIFAVDSKGVVFVMLFNRGLLRIDPQDATQARIVGEAEGIWESSGGIVRGADDSIWFTFQTHLAHLSSGSTTIELDPGIKVPKERIVALLFDGAQTFWLRTETRLMRIDPLLHKLSVEPVKVGMANAEEGKPTLDREGRLLVPSSTGLYWNEGGHWRTITDKQGLSSNVIQSAVEDHEGTLWVGGSGTGLDRLPGVREWSAWTSADGLLDNTIWATLRDNQKRLWVSTARGIEIWDGRSRAWKKIPTPEGSSEKETRQVQLAGDGSVWGLTVTGAIVRIDPVTLATTTYANYHGRNFISIQAAPDGSIWACAHGHLIRFQPGKSGTKQSEIVLPSGENVELEYLSFAPSGVLWATGPSALYRFDGKNWKIFTSRDGLRGQTITSHVALSDNEAWLSYNDVLGVSHVQLQKDGTVQFVERDWDWFIVGIDPERRVWFDGTDGVTVLWPDGRLEKMSHSTGLIWDDLSPWTSVREEADGSYLLSTSRGLARYKPLEGVKEQTRPSVVLTSVSLGGIQRKTNLPVEVRPSDGTLAVQFTPLVLDSPEQVSCRYQLKGLEKESTETQLREIHYGGLPAGNYEFWVQCKSPDARLGASDASFKFRVLPNFWQTGVARIAGVLLLLGCFWLYVSLRTRSLNRRKSELEQAVAQRSAELLQKNKELEEISLTDPLTGTRNRRYFYETIPTDIAQAQRSHLKTADPKMGEQKRQELIFVLVDVDRFKRVNDEMGHAAGDRLLQQVAKRIASVMRRSDDLVRWGGEEFLLVCRTTDRENAALLCDRVLEAIRDLPFDVGNGVEVHKTCSIGWAPFPWIQDDVGLLSLDNVIELADKAMYLAKREGRNRSYGMLPSPAAHKSQRGISIENLRDCPPDLVQIV
jgi:diguanylate cyclase (GGDEF)-like protein